MALAYLQIFADKVELLEPFDDAERGRLLTAMLDYALHDEEPLLTGNERYIWPVFRQMIDQSKQALHAKQTAGHARQTKQSAAPAQQDTAETQQTAADGSSSQQSAAPAQQEAAERPINQESRIKNQESGIRNQEMEEGKRTRFRPPTVDEVIAYARDAGLVINAQRFVDYFTSKGWKVGGSGMKDWRAAVRNWVAREQLPPSRGGPVVKVTEQQQYTQREYTHSDNAVDAMMAEYLAQGAVS